MSDNPWGFLPDDLVPRFLTGLRVEVERGNHEGVYAFIELWRARAKSSREQRSVAVRSAAAQVAVKAANKQGKDPDPRLVKLAENRDPTGTDTDIYKTVPTDATVDWVKSDSFASGTSTIYLVALPVHLDPGYDVAPELAIGYFLDPHEAAIEARRRLEFQVKHSPTEHRHNFAVSGAAVIPVSPNGYEPGLPLRPWSVRLARKGTDSDH